MFSKLWYSQQVFLWYYSHHHIFFFSCFILFFSAATKITPFTYAWHYRQHNEEVPTFGVASDSLIGSGTVGHNLASRLHPTGPVLSRSSTFLSLVSYLLFTSFSLLHHFSLRKTKTLVRIYLIRFWSFISCLRAVFSFGLAENYIFTLKQQPKLQQSSTIFAHFSFCFFVDLIVASWVTSHFAWSLNCPCLLPQKRTTSDD